MATGMNITNSERIYHDQMTAFAHCKRRFISSGCEVTEKSAGANMSVDVSSGTVFFGSVAVDVTGTNEVIDTADATDDRIDLVVVDNSGTVSVLDGSARQDPSDARPPSFNIDTYVLLGRVFVGKTVTSIPDSVITDLRVIDNGVQYTENLYLIDKSNGDVYNLEINDGVFQIEKV